MVAAQVLALAGELGCQGPAGGGRRLRWPPELRPAAQLALVSRAARRRADGVLEGAPHPGARRCLRPAERAEGAGPLGALVGESPPHLEAGESQPLDLVPQHAEAGHLGRPGAGVGGAVEIGDEGALQYFRPHALHPGGPPPGYEDRERERRLERTTDRLVVHVGRCGPGRREGPGFESLLVEEADQEPDRGPGLLSRHPRGDGPATRAKREEPVIDVAAT